MLVRLAALAVAQQRHSCSCPYHQEGVQIPRAISAAWFVLTVCACVGPAAGQPDGEVVAAGDARRYFHAHPELVTRVREGCSEVRLCGGCAGFKRATGGVVEAGGRVDSDASDDAGGGDDADDAGPGDGAGRSGGGHDGGVDAPDNAADAGGGARGKQKKQKKTKKKANRGPKRSIANGVDFGLLERLRSPSGRRLDMPGAAEKLALADVRTYSLVAKVRVPGQPRKEEDREVRAEQSRGHERQGLLATPSKVSRQERANPLILIARYSPAAVLTSCRCGRRS